MSETCVAQRIALVDEDDNIVGYDEKIAVHQRGLLHRAFSVFVVNAHHELLLQRRAWEKYHSPGLWTNTCCSHAIYGEDFSQAPLRRLQQEMGICCPLHWQFTFRYQVAFPNGLIENELDHVYLGEYSETPRPDTSEVAEWKWASVSTIQHDLQENAEAYTYWFKMIFHRLYAVGAI